MLTYLSQSELATLLDLPRQAVSYRAANRLLPTPDIYIGNVITEIPPIAGWLDLRARMYASWSARHRKGTTGRLTLVKDAETPIFWDAKPEWFLSQREAATLFGLLRESVSRRRTRSSWPVDPVVSIGQAGRGSPGWDLQMLLEYRAQDRYLNAAGNLDGRLRRPGAQRKQFAPQAA